MIIFLPIKNDIVVVIILKKQLDRAYTKETIKAIIEDLVVIILEY